MIIYITYPCKVALRGICEGLFLAVSVIFAYFGCFLPFIHILFAFWFCVVLLLFFLWLFCIHIIFTLYYHGIQTIFFKRFFILFYQLPTQLPPTPLYLPHRGGQPALRQERKSRAKATPIFSFYCWYRPFRFEPVKVRVVFPCGNLHPFPLDSHNLPRSVGYADGNRKTKFSRSRSDLPLYGQTASLTLQQTAGQGMRGVCNTPSNSPVVLWKQLWGRGRVLTVRNFFRPFSTIFFAKTLDNVCTK